MVRYVTIGRHEFIPYQVKLLQEKGLTEEVERIANVNNVNDVVERAKQLNAVIVVQTLPPQLLYQLFVVATRNNVPVYMFKMNYEKARIINNPEEANENEVVIPSREGNYRAVPVEGLFKVKNVIFKIEFEE